MTHKTRLFLAIATALAISCKEKEEVIPDSDGDGLNDQEEEELGTDPDNEDSDEDGLTDKEEVDAGTDPLAEDSDEDSYRDGDEVTEGFDPMDYNSRIYTGFWPYNSDKDAMIDPGWDGNNMAEGEPMPRFAWVDQFGEEVDIYDYANQGKPVLVDLSGIWCGWCKEVAKWLGGQSSVFSQYESQYPWIAVMPDMVADGVVLYVTILDSDSSGAAAVPEDVVDWDDWYPNEHVAVLADQNFEMAGYMNPAGYPTVTLFDASLNVEYMNKQDYTDVFQYVLDTYGQDYQ